MVILIILWATTIMIMLMKIIILRWAGVILEGVALPIVAAFGILGEQNGDRDDGADDDDDDDGDGDDVVIGTDFKDI